MRKTPSQQWMLMQLLEVIVGTRIIGWLNWWYEGETKKERAQRNRQMRTRRRKRKQKKTISDGVRCWATVEWRERKCWWCGY